METRPEILIVDDYPQNLFALAKTLEVLDVGIVQATSGLEALGLTLEHDFCMAIVDVQMPEMDGYELAEFLRGNASTATLPVIFVSAIYSSEYYHRKGYDAGAVDFLSKPFVPEILLSKVRVFLELYEQRRRLQALVTELHQANARVTRFNEELEIKVRERTAELERAYAQLEQLDRKKTDFIHVISHELRTPLTLIVGYSQMLLTDPDIQASGRNHDMIAGISRGAQRMHELVNAMFDMARIDSGTLKLAPESIRLADVFANLESELAGTLRERKLALTLADLGALPRIEADPGMVRVLFQHLLLNAIKYTPDGGRIAVTGRGLENDGAAARFLELVVSDTGIGIDVESQELIFIKFYQAGDVSFHSSGRTKFKGGGPGLGLAIARGIVAAHGGRIWVESPGHDETTCPGSAFHVVLPVKQERAATA